MSNFMRLRLRRAAIAGVFGAVLIGLAAPAGAQAMAPETAKQFLTTLGNRTIDAMKSAASEHNSQFTAIMLDSLDFDALATFSLGKLARSVTPADKREFTVLFAAYVIDVAIEKFGNLQIKSFGLGSVTQQPNGDAKVFSRIAAGDKPLEVQWRVHNAGGKPRVNDIEVDGYSLAIHYRGEFERAGLSTVPGLIARLKELTKASKTLPTVHTALK
jgi:phospholipid transport system substrate-binding protein